MEGRLDVRAKRTRLTSIAEPFIKRYAVAIVCWLLVGCQIYSADPISGRVVDKATGEPIEGAVVVAAWIPMGGLEGGNPDGIVQLLEGVTNAKGEYFIPGWGPRPYLGWGRIRSSSPQLLFFKYGFNPKLEGELNYLTTNAPSHMTSSRAGQQIGLDRASLPISEYAGRLISIDSYVLNPLLDSGGCLWKQVPNLLAAVDRGHRALKEAGLESAPLKTFEQLQPYSSCGNVQQFVSERTQ